MSLKIHSLRFSFNDQFPAHPAVSRYQIVSVPDFIAARDDGGDGDNWNYKTCKASVKSSPPTNQHSNFYRPDALFVAQSTISKKVKKNSK